MAADLPRAYGSVHQTLKNMFTGDTGCQPHTLGRAYIPAVELPELSAPRSAHPHDEVFVLHTVQRADNLYVGTRRYAKVGHKPETPEVGTTR